MKNIIKSVITNVCAFTHYVMSCIDSPIKRRSTDKVVATKWVEDKKSKKSIPVEFKIKYGWNHYAQRLAFTAVTLAMLTAVTGIAYKNHETAIKQKINTIAFRITGTANYIATPQKADASVATSTQGTFQQVVPPLLKKIACGESKQHHIDPSTKQVMINRTMDVGYYQINAPTWGKKAYELGYDIFTPEGNEAMAIWIYNNYGPSEWVAKPSNKCSAK